MINNVFNKEGSINIVNIKEYINIYYNSTGINVSVIDNLGNTIASCGEAPIICTFIRSQNKQDNCELFHLNAAKISEQIGEEYIFSCFTGLIHFAVPLISNKEFRGALIGGPVLMDYPDEILADSVLIKNGLSPRLKGKVLSFIRAVPVVETSKVRYLSKLLYILGCNFMNEDRHILDERKAKFHQQSKIGEIIQDIKLENIDNIYYPYLKEKELMAKVKNGDVIGAKAILNDILGFIFFQTGGKIEIIKARTLELCTLLSRAVVGGGASLDKIFGLNYKLIGELSKINNLEDLSYWTIGVLDRFGENVFNLSDSRNGELLNKALNYINDNYMNEINLEVIANYVHLNPSYFSSLFKKETGIGFTDYLNKVRIEASKQFLKDIDNSILDVALAVGFEDQSYYSKVFKKVIGKTPKQYKDNFS